MGLSEDVWQVDTGSTATSLLVAPDGSRLSVLTGTTLGWTIPDLHGSLVATTDTADALSSALRYDGYGQTQSSWTASGPLPSPWRYQGRLELSPDAANPLYENGARSYSPGLGAFTQLDSYTGSAQDPLSMNRYLYAEANPATLIDPTGHYVQRAPDSSRPDSHLAPGTGGGQIAPVYQAPAYQPPPQPGRSGPQQYADPGGANVNPWPSYTADQYQQMTPQQQDVLLANYGAEAFAGFFSTAHPWNDPFMIVLARDYLRFYLRPGNATGQRYLPLLEERTSQAMFDDDVYFGDAADIGASGLSLEAASIATGFYEQIGERVGGSLRSRGPTIPSVGSGGKSGRIEWQSNQHTQDQLSSRGWTSEDIEATVQRPANVIPGLRDTRHHNFGRNNDPATGYVNADGSYVIVNDRTGDVV